MEGVGGAEKGFEETQLAESRSRDRMSEGWEGRKMRRTLTLK